ncbi:hypothetical protein OS493_002442 [Desmophyllum pertusum]|uniref:Protein kinase domain-containing protein n=1 Tax=Desmophyllum pertusum TaxID=174260 RepID=A0A9X0CMU3_9CNID|nr:hypothetical protein OS493_002442 [Desmophyllum pertusum]
MEELGRGAFGKVHKGVLRELPVVEVFYKPREQRVEIKEGKVVAIKTLLETATEEGKDQLLQEIEFMKQVGSHRNILSMLGYWVKSEPIMLILEYVSTRGSSSVAEKQKTTGMTISIPFTEDSYKNNVNGYGHPCWKQIQ